jgi:adenine-specific DNA-methyltransferase
VAVRFLGHKDHLLSAIRDATESVGKIQTVGDLFCGTGAVSKEFRSMGLKVTANDMLLQCVTLAKAQLLVNGEPSFEQLFAHEEALRYVPIPVLFDSPYNRVLGLLNSLPGVEGFFYRNYSPGGTRHLEKPRMYFTDSNAQKIDAIRMTIRDWFANGLLDDREHSVLLKDLMYAVNDVANIAGTYGYFLSTWHDRSIFPIQVKRSNIPTGRVDHVITNEDANQLSRRIRVDLAYLDPPYTKRQYSSYYHILETIAAEDEPEISGKSGLRHWGEKASDYCYKRRAVGALDDLVSHLDTDHIFLSYSEDGHVSHDEILSILSARGEPKFLEFITPRFKSNLGGVKGRELKERLYMVDARR